MAASWRWIGCAIFAWFVMLNGALYLFPLSGKCRAVLQRVRVVSVICTINIIFSTYVWRTIRIGLENLPGDVKMVKPVCKYAFQSFVCLGLFSYATNIFLTGTDPSWIASFCFLCLGVSVQLNFFTVAINFAEFMWSWTAKTFWTNTYNEQLSQAHRMDVRNSSQEKTSKSTYRVTKVVLIFACALTASGYAVYNASQPPVIKLVSVTIDGLPRSMSGFKIVQINDIHLGPTVGKERLEMIVDIVNKLQPDVVALVGDLVDGSVRQLQGAAVALKAIRTKQGKYFVSGNHEYYTADVDNWFRYLELLDFKVLHNDHVHIVGSTDSDADYFCLAGVDDLAAKKFGYEGHGMDLEKAMGSCDPSKPIILLAHQPAAALEAIHSKYNVQLVLSGHTHGGQIFPLVMAAYFANPFYAGLYQRNGRHVYVSQGTVYWGIPMRLGTTPEVAQITLTAA